MDDSNNLDKSESTDENDERSETETECFEKADSEIISQSENTQEYRCLECNVSFQLYDEFQKHKIYKHPIVIYKCIVDSCQRWFSSRKSRDKHSENSKSQLHKSMYFKSPPLNAIFIENATEEQLEILKMCKNENNSSIKAKYKRGPKPKMTTESEFLVGLPRDQLKRKLMESVVEKLESSTNSKASQESLSKFPKRATIEQISSASKPNNGNSPRFVSKNQRIKNSDCNKNIVDQVVAIKPKAIPDLSHIKVPILSLDSPCSIDKFVEDLINLLTIYDPAEFFKYPLIDCFAPTSSQLGKQIDMKTIQKRLKEGRYSERLENLENDLLLLYGNGFQSFVEKSQGWCESGKLYQTALVNIHNAKKVFANTKIVSEGNMKLPSSTNSDLKSNNSTVLNLMNPYNKGQINDFERIMPIGDQVGTLKSGTQNLAGYKEDRRNKVTVLSYLDYGTNFSFGPSYDSGNSYCSKETSDSLIRNYSDASFFDDFQCEDLNELVIPEITLGDDFSLYLMNVFTKDIIKSCPLSDWKSDNQSTSMQTSASEPANQTTDDNNDDDGGGSSNSSLQILLDESWRDLARLKSFNYQRLSKYQLQPSNEEQSISEKVTKNLINLIVKTNPQSITNLNMIRKALNCK